MEPGANWSTQFSALHDAPSISSGPSMRHQDLQQSYKGPEQSMMHTQPSLGEPGSMLRTSQLTPYGAYPPSFSSSPADMAFPQRSYGNSQPFNYDPRFTSELYRYGGPDLSASLNGLHAAQGLGFSGTREAYVTTWCDSGFLSPSTFRLPRSKAQSTVPPISPFPTDLEVSTLNPSVDLQRVPFGSDDSNSMSGISLASPGSARSDTTLPGNVNTIVISPDICLLTPRASTREGTIDMTAAGSSNDNVCELERTPTMSEARSRIRIPTENASMASTDQPGKLNYKKKHDLVRIALILHHSDQCIDHL